MTVKKVAALVVLVVVASLSVAGCTLNLPKTSSPTPTPTPTPMPTVSTPTPPADYSSYFNKAWEGGNAIMDRPFTKSTNTRGNDVYKGITRNSSLPESRSVTTVIELTKSKAEVKQLYDQTVAQKINEGFTPRYDWIAAQKVTYPFITDLWTGQQYGSGLQFTVEYYYDSYVSSWLLVTEVGY